MRKLRKKIVIGISIVSVIAVAQWISILMAMSYERPLGEEPMACAAVAVRAINVFTGAIHGFADPCSVPPGWIVF